jgi:dihydromethanopterin reductase (acceptor)
MGEKRIAWAITGAGHNLEECVSALLKQKRVDIFLSRSAEEVLRMYDLYTRINAPDARLYQETQASAPLIGRLSAGMYRVLVVAPATSNSLAKFVYGIADTLVTNMFAQAGKSRVPVIVYPTDLAPEMNSSTPNQKSIKVFPRPIDLENTARLRAFIGVHVVNNREELERSLVPYM